MSAEDAADDSLDLTDEQVDEAFAPVTTAAPTRPQWREPLPYEERVRVALLWVFGVGALILLGIQMWVALHLDAKSYQAVSPPLAALSTLATASLGAAAVYYFTQPKK